MSQGMFCEIRFEELFELLGGGRRYLSFRGRRGSLIFDCRRKIRPMFLNLPKL